MVYVPMTEINKYQGMCIFNRNISLFILRRMIYPFVTPNILNYAAEFKEKEQHPKQLKPLSIDDSIELNSSTHLVCYLKYSLETVLKQFQRIRGKHIQIQD